MSYRWSSADDRDGLIADARYREARASWRGCSRHPFILEWCAREGGHGMAAAVPPDMLESCWRRQGHPTRPHRTIDEPSVGHAGRE